MCGIAGVFYFKHNDSLVNIPLLERMRDTLEHRGPDDKGFFVSEDGKVGLAHRRLSILDLSEKAKQPMSNEDGTLWVIFNGEIYNYLEIRKELIQTGRHIFKTDHSDTEVIIHSFEEWGIDCIEKFVGMFAIAIVDLKKKELWLIRDRIGKKPIYYNLNGKGIIFASEIKALLKYPDIKKEIDDEAFYHYLSFLTTPAPNTLFKGIKKVPAGHWLKVESDGRVQEYKYWDVLLRTNPICNSNEEEISEILLNKLKESVEIRKVSDVPVGVFLSGGIDSSINAVLFSRNSKERVKTFSIGYEGEYESYKNELDYARLVAKKINSEHFELKLKVDDLINFVPKMVYLQDEPIADPVCVPLYYVSKLARDSGVIVCQIGEGSDELFCGYNSWIRKIKLEELNAKYGVDFLKKSLFKVLGAIGKSNEFYYEWLRRSLNNQPIFWGGAEAFPETLKKKIISQRLQKKFDKYSSFEVIRNYYSNFQKNVWEKSYLNWMTYLDLNIRLPELLLMRVDKMTMGVSLEARAPFLDHRLVEFVMSIPTSIKFKNGIAKYILKQSVKNILPDEILNRKKQGFGVPIYEWFYEKLKPIIHNELSFFAKNEDYLNLKSINEEIRDPQQLWFLYNFVCWWKKFIYE